MDISNLLVGLKKKPLSEDEKKKKIERSAFAKKNKSHKFCKTVIVTFLLSFLVFLTSGIWLPRQTKDDYPVFHEYMAWGSNKQISIVRFDYCEEQGVAEIELDILQEQYEKGSRYISVTQGDSSDILATTFPIDEQNNIVARITGITSSSKVLNIVCGYERAEDDADIISFGYKPKNVSQVANLDEKTEAEYKIQRCNINLSLYDEEQKRIKSLIAEQQSIIDDVAGKNEDLKLLLPDQTTEEQLEINKQIESNLQASGTAVEAIKEYNEQLIELENHIEEEKAKISKLQVTQ